MAFIGTWSQTKIFKKIFMDDLQQLCRTFRLNIPTFWSFIFNNFSANMEDTVVMHDGVPS